jgi:hypothetical protein
LGAVLVGILSLVACVFIASAASKLRSRRAFAAFRTGLGETALVPSRRLGITAALLAGAEAVMAALLVAASILQGTGNPRAIALTEVALAGAAALVAVLASGVAAVMRRGTAARCACFGASAALPLGRVHLARNLTLLAVIAAGLALGPLVQPAAAADSAIAGIAGLVLALLIIRWEDLAVLFAPMPQAGGR